MLKTVLAALCVAVAAVAGPATAQGASPTLTKIKAARAINVDYSPDSAPFSSVTGNAAPQGYSIELCKRVVAQIARAVGEPEQNVNTTVGGIGVRYDDGTVATVQQTTAPALRIGDRVRVSNTGIELLK